jgi:hypothetical protein
VTDAAQFGIQEAPGQKVGTLKFAVEWDPSWERAASGRAILRGETTRPFNLTRFLGSSA